MDSIRLARERDALCPLSTTRFASLATQCGACATPGIVRGPFLGFMSLVGEAETERAGLKLDPEKSFGYLVRRCHRRFDRLLANYLSPHDLKTGFWYYLRVLWIKDGVTQQYLSAMTNVTENTTVTMIDGMVRSGLVRRRRDLLDRRKMCVTLTSKGRRLESELIGYAIGINEVATRGIDPNELEVCAKVLTKMSANLQIELGQLDMPD